MLRGSKIVAGVALLLLFLTVSFGFGYHVGSQQAEKRMIKMLAESPTLGLVQEAIDIIEENFYQEVSLKKLIPGAVKGTIEALDDPYSHYMNKSVYGEFQEESSGSFSGVGIEIDIVEGQLTVISPLENTPAHRAGLKPGDKIVQIDGKSTKGISREKAVSLIRGEEGTTVILKIVREGEDKPLEFRLIREKIKYPNVITKMLDKDLGYLRIHFFYGDTSSDVKEALDKLKKDGAKGIILDLRSNPGGLLVEAIQSASLFIESGPIVIEKYRDGEEKVHGATGDADEKIPLVVLINKGSASASEIMAGAIQDKKRGKLVGEKTFGKGCVQSVEMLSDGSAIVITVAAYYTPNGKEVHKKGITPDFLIKSVNDEANKIDEQLEKAKEVLKEMIYSSSSSNSSSKE